MERAKRMGLEIKICMKKDEEFCTLRNGSAGGHTGHANKDVKGHQKGQSDQFFSLLNPDRAAATEVKEAAEENKKKHFIIQKQLLERSSAKGIACWTQHIMDGSLHTSGSAAGKSQCRDVLYLFSRASLLL